MFSSKQETVLNIEVEDLAASSGDEAHHNSRIPVLNTLTKMVRASYIQILALKIKWCFLNADQVVFYRFLLCIKRDPTPTFGQVS